MNLMLIRSIRIGILLCLMALNLNAANDNLKYGLSFNSHSVSVNQRTTLSLDGGEAFAVGDDFTLSFSVLVRNNEPAFGSILHLIADDGQVIHFSIVVDDNKNVPALVYGDDMSIFPFPIVTEKWQDVKLRVDARKNKIVLFYQGKERAFTIPLNGTKHLKVQFGRIDGYVSDVAPMILKDVKVAVDGKQIRYWKLYKHNGGSCLDEQAQKNAVATNPLWIIDNHILWKQVYHAKLTGIQSVAFNAQKSLFYVCSDREVLALNTNGYVVKRQKVLGGYRANTGSNGYVAYDTKTNQIASFSLRSGKVSRFDENTSRWSMSERYDSAAFYYNHAGVYNHADSSYYFFGGYGFYAYHNDLFRLRAGGNQVERINYQNPIPPRFGAAMGIADGKLYILGGRGNKAGKQAVESYFYFELWSIDLKTKKAELVWRRNSYPKGWVLATTMLYQPEKKAFYALNMNDRGGTMYQVNVGDTTITEVAKPIGNTITFQDFEYNMFYSPKDGHIYAVIDKILADKSHDLSIYQLATPLLSEAEISQTDGEEGSGAKIWLIAIVAVLALLGIIVLFGRKRKKPSEAKPASTVMEPPTVEKAVKTEQIEKAEKVDEEPVADDTEEVQQEEMVKHFDRTHSAVSLLGAFSVYDKEGADITAQFTPRLKELFLLLILYSEKRKHGVSVDKVTEIIWFDKDESSARNNRNVTLRKLRVLLEKVGNVEIISSNGYLSVKWGKDVFCDYHTLLQYVEAYNTGNYQDADELLARLLEILLYGPLLPGYETEWLDEFKNANSSLSIDLLNKLLRQENDKHNDKMTVCISDIIFRHDPLNDEALAAKCQVLSHQGKKGLAKRAYDRFCKEYRDSMGEDYEVAFAELAK